jgi:predicted deacylase
MKITVEVGGIKVTTNGINLSKNDIFKMLEAAGSVALAILEHEGEDLQPYRDPIGFSAHIERAPEPAAENFYSDDEE